MSLIVTVDSLGSVSCGPQMPTEIRALLPVLLSSRVPRRWFYQPPHGSNYYPSAQTYVSSLDHVWDSIFMLPRYTSLGRPAVTASSSFQGLFLLWCPLPQSLTLYLPDTVPCLSAREHLLALSTSVPLHRPTYFPALVTAMAHKHFYSHTHKIHSVD